jgi:hypothetical protein
VRLLRFNSRFAFRVAAAFLRACALAVLAAAAFLLAIVFKRERSSDGTPSHRASPPILAIFLFCLLYHSLTALGIGLRLFSPIRP